RPDVEEWRQRARQQWDERRTQVTQKQMPGTIAGFGGSGRYDPERGVGSSSFSRWDGDTFVVETLRRHKGHEFTVIERIRLDADQLTYRHEIQGPGNKSDEREIVFQL